MNNLKARAPEGATAKVLLTDTNRWSLAARLAGGVAEAGCEGSAVCPMPGHALSITRAVQRTFPYSAFRPLESLTAAIEAVDPDIIVPSCDRGVEHLHHLYARVQKGAAQKTKLAALIEHSLGSPDSYSIVSSRYDLLMLAREEGVRTPDTKPVNTPEEVESWRTQGAFPWVLKPEGT